MNEATKAVKGSTQSGSGSALREPETVAERITSEWDLKASRPVCSDLMPIGLSKREHGVGRGRVVHEERGAWSHVMFYVFV